MAMRKVLGLVGTGNSETNATAKRWLDYPQKRRMRLSTKVWLFVASSEFELTSEEHGCTRP